MPVFEYKAMTPRGGTRAGIVDADSLTAARLKLRKTSLYPISLKKLESGGVLKTGNRLESVIALRFSRVKPIEVATATRLLSTLSGAGFPLVKALAAVAGQARSSSLNRVLLRVRDAVKEGSSLAQAMAAYPGVFSPVYTNMVAAGESSGTLDIVLDRLADFAENREETRKKIWASLAYPIIMSVIGFLVLVILMTYIVPSIVGIFSDMNQTLPLPTQILITASQGFSNWWWAILALPPSCVLAVWGLRTTQRGSMATDRIILHLPIAGSMIIRLAAARVSRTLGSLLANGVPMLTALGISQNVAGNRIISDLIKNAADTVEKGGELGSALAGSRYFPDLAVQMLQVGEASGQMESMLEKTADLYEKEIQSAVTAATALIEPLIILVMGLVVGLIIMAVCLPIVEINQMVG